jgi:sugar phosphate isomerase/epimerase
MKFGLCCSPQTLAYSHPQFQDNIARLRQAGAEYLEFPVAATSPEGDAREFDALRSALENAPLRIEAFNSFIPAHHRITGPDVELKSVLSFCHVALERCKSLGGEVVVLGSAGARKVPEGFEKEQAEKQFVKFCRELGPLAAETGVTICIEPLNAREDNLILSVRHGARIVDEVAHENIQLLADLYHIELEGEPLENVAAAGARLRHTHVADVGRVAPGYAAQGEADFRGFFAALNRAGYDRSTPAARCSFEGSYDDMFAQAEPLVSLLRDRYNAAASSR